MEMYVFKKVYYMLFNTNLRHHIGALDTVDYTLSLFNSSKCWPSESSSKNPENIYHSFYKNIKQHIIIIINVS